MGCFDRVLLYPLRICTELWETHTLLVDPNFCAAAETRLSRPNARENVESLSPSAGRGCRKMPCSCDQIQMSSGLAYFTSKCFLTQYIVQGIFYFCVFQAWLIASRRCIQYRPSFQFSTRHVAYFLLKSMRARLPCAFRRHLVTFGHNLSGCRASGHEALCHQGVKTSTMPFSGSKHRW